MTGGDWFKLFGALCGLAALGWNAWSWWGARRQKARVAAIGAAEEAADLEKVRVGQAARREQLEKLSPELRDAIERSDAAFEASRAASNA